jgi:peptidyl-dipeptidase A
LDADSEQRPDVGGRRRRLEKRIVEFRPRWEGKRVGRQVVRDVLRTDRDPSRRRAAFYAEDPLYQGMEPELAELIRLRNAAAHDAGYANYAALRLEFEGFSVVRLQAMLDRVLAAARRPIREFRRMYLESTGATAWFPWDVNHALEGGGPLPATAFRPGRMVPDVLAALRQWGFRRPQLEFRVVRHDLPFGGLTFPVHVPDDVRVLVHPRGGWESYMVLFHEFGHAVHARSVRQPSHLLRNGLGYAAYQEGLADLFEEVAFQRPWLLGRPTVTRDQVVAFERARRRENLLRATQMALAVRRELDLYEHPDRPTGADHYRRLRSTFGFGRYRPPSWASPLLVTHPVYTQSYLLSLLFRKQVLAAMLEEVGPRLWPNRRVGPWLTEGFLRKGARYDWLELVREATGQPLGVEKFLAATR